MTPYDDTELTDTHTHTTSGTTDANDKGECLLSAPQSCDSTAVRTVSSAFLSAWPSPTASGPGNTRDVDTPRPGSFRASTPTAEGDDATSTEEEEEPQTWFTRKILPWEITSREIHRGLSALKPSWKPASEALQKSVSESVHSLLDGKAKEGQDWQGDVSRCRKEISEAGWVADRRALEPFLLRQSLGPAEPSGLQIDIIVGDNVYEGTRLKVYKSDYVGSLVLGEPSESPTELEAGRTLIIDA
ncbi:hypothetical protein I350_05057 [Cryptococcus amylolentus CBS 6273]|uniref:Uncharacterized protein n=1 Tax=Cryptococcus amylolentus CBS 6273 TaxID=1296118 RepID=A0A1E3JYY4_9TREE|nr:hypothetical protein I350_05057 [Cryptococcus amylolentus CBS 6273]